MEQDLQKLLRKIKHEAQKRGVEILPPDLTGAAYDPFSKTIYGSHPVTLAHELGHAIQHEEHPALPFVVPAAEIGGVVPYIALASVSRYAGPKWSDVLRRIGIISLVGAGGYAFGRLLNHLLVKSEKDAWERAMKLAPQRVRPLMKEVAEKAVGTYKVHETNWPFIGTVAGVIGSIIAAKALGKKVPPTVIRYLIPALGLTAGSLYSLIRGEQLRQDIEDILFRQSKRK